MRRIHFLGIDLYGCKEALERLDDYIDRELSPEETRKVAQHLKICHQCTKKFRFEQEFVAMVRTRLQHLSVPERLKEKVALALEAEKKNAQ
jgi:anti-sigma factor (TIGR02949 family)